MDKTAIKTFAINSRKKLMEDVEYKMSLVGIDKDNIYEPISSANGIETYQLGGSTNSIYDNDISKRERLVKEVKQKGFENVVEEVAYTWFNRIIAIRFMEINNFLPTKTRVLSSETAGKIEPDIITEAFDVDLDYTQEDKELIFKLKDENKLDELFRFLFIKQCNKLNEILPGLFEKTDDYLELLLNISFTNEDGVVRQLIDTIPEKDFESQVEVIGWLYQFYNTELKDETFANLKKRIKISKERIPAATQLFTPDWIVKYMVENSVGRLWLEGHPNNELKSKWKYYVDEAKQEPEVEQQLITIRKESEILKPEDITVIDPCMGSGHILVYVFEVLMDIYVSEGFTEKDACESILKNNIYGLDIDKRAYQLAYFAVLMKARKYNRRILTKGISPLLCSIEETNSISKEFIEELISQDKTNEKDWNYLYNIFKNAKEYGSILDIKNINFDELFNDIGTYESDKNNLNQYKYQNEIQLMKNIIQQSKFLVKNYDIVATNPPYMGNSGMNPNLKDYLKKNYPNSKSDLFAVFIEKCHDFCNEKGFVAMITQQSFMFLSTFEKLRVELINNHTIINMAHLGAHAFEEIGGEVVQATTFVNKNNLIENYKSTFHRLTEFNSESKKEEEFHSDENKFILSQSIFNLAPSFEFIFWENHNILNSFKLYPPLSKYGKPSRGLATYNDNKFLRYWYEVSFNKIGFGCSSVDDSIKSKKKWFPYNKGGDYKKWYGNNNFVVNFYNGGEEIKKSGKGAFSNINYYFKKGLTWSRISSSYFGVRYHDVGFIIGDAGPSVLMNDDSNIFYIFGILLSNFTLRIISALNSTMTFQVGDLNKVPINMNNHEKENIEKLVKSCIYISKEEWDEFELSWDFKNHYAIKFSQDSFENTFFKYMDFKNNQYNKLKKNEFILNNLINKIYNITDIQDSVVSIKNEITLTKIHLEEFVKSFISYAVGCMFGRYSLDNEGLQFAGGEFNINNYSKFIPDDDNIIPVLDSEYFEDDIVNRFVEFVKTCFGEETLEENLDFIANALAKNKKPSREKIREYMLKNFFNDHKKTYKKCPIYWQFSSGKENGFNCLVYMHRYEPSLVARIRTDYLHKTQKAIEQAIANCDNIINHSSSNTEVTKATKEKSKLQKQLKETQEYDEALAHIANQNIKINLDDGVKVNYAKFQNIEVSKEGKKSKKINLLKKL